MGAGVIGAGAMGTGAVGAGGMGAGQATGADPLPGDLGGDLEDELYEDEYGLFSTDEYGYSYEDDFDASLKPLPYPDPPHLSSAGVAEGFLPGGQPAASVANAAAAGERSILLDDVYMGLLSSQAAWSSTELASLSDEDLEHAANGFARLDAAREGTLSALEFDRLLQVVRAAEDDPPPSAAEVQQSFLTADKDGNGRLDFNEYLHYVSLNVSVSWAELEAVLRRHVRL
uniref:EF-hand domain-containing protein n=1 Tax=Haptolina brevifila TaxID=156173 RepID=A0A7S2BTZ0_9EUKA